MNSIKCFKCGDRINFDTDEEKLKMSGTKRPLCFECRNKLKSMFKKIILIAILFLFPFQTFALSVGVIADIHADSKKKRVAGHSTVYPKRGVKYFKKALKKMRGKVDVVVVLGDNTNSGKRKYYKQLKKVEKKYKIKTLWVKGNHDSRHFNLLSGKTNYYVDFDDVRIIVLDTNSGSINGNGGITPEGLRLYEEASQTDKKVVVAMHHPPFNKATKTCDWNPEYDWVSEADMILAGHWHKAVNCGDFKIFPALTEKKKLNYSIVEI